MPEFLPIIPSDLSNGPVPERAPFVPSVAQPAQYNSNLRGADVFASLALQGKKENDPLIATPENITRRYPEYNPYVDNEQGYALAQSPFTDAFNGVVKGLGTFASTFAQQMMAIPDYIRTAGGGNMYKNSASEGLDEWVSSLEDKFPNYYSTWEKEHPFASAIPFTGGGANFWFDKIFKNLGFTAGAIAGAVATDALVGPLLAETLVPAQVGKAAMQLNKLFGFGDDGLKTLINSTKHINSSEQAVFRLSNLAAAATQKKIQDGARFAATMYGSAHTEAAIEAREGYNNIKEDLTAQYIKKHGTAPVGEELTKIEQMATAGGNARYGLNLALLIPSNVVQFNTILRPFSSFKNSLSKGIQSQVADQSGKIGLATSKVANLSDIDDLIIKQGTNKFWNNIYNKAVKPIIPNILSEGVYEEGGQFAVEKGISKYFSDKYSGVHKSETDNLINSITHGLSQQFGSTEGLENMYIGAIIGGITAPISSVVSNAKRRKVGMFTPDEATNVALSRLKDFSITGAFENNYDNAASTTKRQADLQQAVKNDDIFAFKNIKANMFFDYIVSGIKANRFDVRVAQLELLKDLSDEEFNKLFNTTSEERPAVNSYVDSLIAKANQINSSYKSISNVIRNPFTYRGNTGTEEGMNENQSYLEFENYKAALTNMTFNSEDYASRLSDIDSQLRSISSLLQGDRVSRLTNKNELANFAKDYAFKAEELEKQLQDSKGLDASIREEIRTKSKRYNTLNRNIIDFLSTPQFDEVKYSKLFNDLLNFQINNESAKNSVEVPKDKIPEIITLANDVKKLNEAKTYASNVFDYLLTGEGFKDFMENAEEWRESVHTGDKAKPEEETIKVGKSEFIPDREYSSTKEQAFSITKVGEEYRVKSPLGDTISTFDNEEEANLELKNLNDNLATLGKVKVLKVNDNGTVQVEDANGNIQNIQPGLIKDYSLIKTQAEIASENKEFNESIDNQLNDLITAEGAESVTKGEPTKDTFDEEGEFESSKKPLWKLFRSGTYNHKTSGHKDFVKRQQLFFINSPHFSNRAELRAILITPNNEAFFGLSGLSEMIMEGSGLDLKDPKTAPISQVFVELEEGTMYFVDRNGDRINKVGEPTDINSVIVSTLPTSSLYWSSGTETRYSKGTEQDAKEYSRQWEAKRNELLALIDKTETYQFVISKGVAVREEGLRNALTDVLIPDSELDEAGILKVATLKSVNFNGEQINVPLGAVIFQYGSTLEILDVRKFSVKESALIYDLFHKLASDSRNTGKLDATISNYLQGILYWNLDRAAKGAKQIGFDRETGSFVFGEDSEGTPLSVPFTPEAFEASRKDIVDFLSNSYINVNSKKLIKNAPFLEIKGINEDGSLETKVWKTYQRFLSSAEDRTVEEIPLYTDIVKPIEGEPNFIHKYATITTNNEGKKLIAGITPKKVEPVVAPKVEEVVADTTAPEEEIVQVSLGGGLVLSWKLIEDGQNVEIIDLKDASGNTLPLKPEDIVKLRNLVIESENIVVAKPEPKVTQPITTKEEVKIVEEAKAATPKKPSSRGGSYRPMVGNSYILQNIEKETANVERMLGKSIPIFRVNNLIETTSGGYAFGQFKNSAIYLYEYAEVGTAYHEAFEAVWAKFTNLQERINVIKEFNQREGSYVDRESGETINYSDATEHQAKEQLAEEFAYFVQNDKLLFKPKKEGNLIYRLFKDLLNFIKRFFTGNVNNEVELFKLINAGYYRTAPSSQEYSDPYGSFKMVTIPGLSSTDTHRIVQGISIEIVQKIFEKSTGIIANLEENEIEVNKLYKEVYNELKTLYTTNEFDESVDNLEDEKLRELYKKVWNDVNKNWPFVVNLADKYLEQYGIKRKKTTELDQDTYYNSEEIVENESLKDQSDLLGSDRSEAYTVDYFKLDFINKSSSSIKLLLSTLPKSQYVDFDSNKPVQDVTSVPDPGTYMQQSLNYNDVYNFLMDKLYTANTLEDMRKTLYQIQAHNPNYVRLYKRLKFHLSDDQITLSDWTLRTRFFNLFSKQRPEGLIQYTDGDEVYTAESNINSTVAQIVRGWIDGLKLLDNGLVKIDGTSYSFDKTVLEGYKVDNSTNQLRFLSALGIDFTEVMYNRLTPKEINSLSENTGRLYNALRSSKKTSDITPKGLGVKTVMEDIAKLFISASGQGLTSTFTNIDGEQVQNYILKNNVSFVTNDLNSQPNLKSLYEKYPHFKDRYRESSMYLKAGGLLFDGNGNRRVKDPLRIGYIQGNIVLGEENETQPNSTLSLAQRRVLEINQNFNKKYYVLVPADSKTEWLLKMEHPFSYEEMQSESTWNNILNQFEQYYNSERDIAGNSEKYKGIFYPEYSLKDGSFDRDEFREYIAQAAVSKIDFFLDSGNIVPDDIEYTDRSEQVAKPQTYTLVGFDSDFIKEHGLEKLTYEELVKLFEFTEVNYSANNVEFHKLFFGDVAAIKDPTKRYKSFESPRESTIVDYRYDAVLNRDLNKVGNIRLTDADPGHWNFKGYMITATIQDILTETPSLSNDKRLDKSVRDSYKRNNSADAQSWMVISSYRELELKRGTWDSGKERQYQYQMALDRFLMDKDTRAGILPKEIGYTYSSNELKQADEQLIKKNPNSGIFNPLKPIGSGTSNAGKTFLHKTSAAPITYSLFRNRTEDGRIEVATLGYQYAKAIKQGISYMIVESGVKIGIDGINSFYNEDGTPNTSDFEGNVEVPFQYYGTQVETSGQKDKATMGSQLTKLATQNLLNAGVPIDYKGTRTQWNGLTEIEKQGKSPIYKAVRHNIETLKELQRVGYAELLDKFDIVDVGGSFEIGDKSKLEELLQDELLRRSASENKRSTVTIDKETGDFIMPFEASVAYEEIKNILYSYVDKLIARPKVNGGQNIQVASAGFEVGGMKVVTGKDKNGRPVLVTKGLEFYEAQYNEKGKRVSVSRMEIMLPNWFKKKMKGSGLKMSDTELIEYLNKNTDILQGVGFRIPTQDTNSVEAFTVKGFLPDYMGNSVIVPEAITTKSGSDFDVDKLNLYLKNVIFAEGKLMTVPYYGTGAEALEKLSMLKLSSIASKNVTAAGALEDFEFEDDVEDDFDASALYRESIENEYFRSIEQLILLPENFERLISPNNTDDIVAVKNLLVDLAPNEFGVSLDASVIDRDYMSNQRHLFLVGKPGVGIAASSQTNNAVNQLSAIYIDPNRIDFMKRYLRNWVPDVNIYLDHNTIEVDGKNYPTVSLIEDKAGKYISEKISQYLNGFVDIAKDPFISQIISNSDLTGTFLFLEKVGVPMKTIGLFMNQPIVREYVKLLQKQGNLGLFQSKKFVDRNIFPIFASANSFIGKLENKDLENSIRKYYNGESLTAQENAMQRFILREFLKYSAFASNLFDLQRGSSYDTDSASEPNMRIRKDANYENARFNAFSSLDKMMDASFLTETRELTGKGISVVQQSMFKLGSGRARFTINNVIKQVNEISGVDQLTYKKAARMVEQAFVDYMIHTNGGTNTRLTELLIDTKRSVAYRLRQIKNEAPKNSDLANNEALRKLVSIIRNDTRYAKNVNLLYKVTDAFTSDLYSSSLRELRDNPLTTELYYDLIQLSFLQSGVGMNPLSYSKYIPFEDYQTIIGPIIEKVNTYENVEQFYHLGAFYRNMWSNRKLVPTIMEDYFHESNSRPDEERMGQSKIKMRNFKWYSDLKTAKGVKSPKNRPYLISPNSRAGTAPMITAELYESWEGSRLSGDEAEIPTTILLKRLQDPTGIPVEYTDTYGTFYVYYPVNAWGNGFRGKEYYSSPVMSAYSKPLKHEIISKTDSSLKEVYFDTENGYVPVTELNEIDVYNAFIAKFGKDYEQIPTEVAPTAQTVVEDIISEENIDTIEEKKKDLGFKKGDCK